MVYSNNFNQVRVGVRNGVVTQVVNAVDADATAFIAAAGITNLTQAAAISTLVNDLKTYGIWSKMKALYPFVGGSAASHKFNLKDPRDLDAAYRLVFNGGWVHSSTGALPNGTTGYADTKLKPFGVFNNTTYAHISYYSRTSSGFNNSEYGMGVSEGTANLCFILRRLNNTQAFFSTFSNATYQWVWNTTSTDGSGLFVGTQQGTNIKLLKQNILQGSNTQLGSGSTTPPNLNVFIGALNLDGLSGNYTNKESAFASIGDGLSDTEATNFYNSVQKFQTTLGRQIGSPIVSDTDAQSFINVAGLTDLGQANAVNTLVVDLKAAGVWTKMKAIYPFVGGTAASHKWNLKDPRDVDAAFRLSFTGGWTHTSTGALPNGSNAYAETKFSEYNNITNGDSQLSNYSHLSLYSRTNASSLDTYGGIGIYDYQDYGSSFVLTLKRADGLSYAYSKNLNTAPVSMPDSRGFFILNRQSNSLLKYNRNDVLIAQNTSSAGAGGTRNGVTLGSVYDWGRRYYDNKEHAFVSIGFSLTDAEASAFYTAVQKYQTTLGRQIGTPVLESGQTAGLLDTYSSAAAAYSLRKLRTGYYGFAIRVRRSSDNLEQDISFKADGTLDTASLLAFVGSGNGFVTTWYDQSGNGYNVSHITSSQQPEIVVSGSLITNLGKVSIRFGLVSGGVTYLQNSSLSLNTPDITIIYLGNKINSGNSLNVYSTPISLRTPSTQDWNNINNIGTRMVNPYVVANGNIGLQYNSTLYSQTYSFNTSYLMWNQKINNNFSVGKNGNTFVTNIAGTSANITSNLLVLGGTIFNADSYLNGYLSEVIIYASNQSSNRTGIESNINSYYSIY